MKLDATNDPAIRDFEQWVRGELHGTNRKEEAERQRDAERFVVHEPTGVVECNDSKCPLGATTVGWPHNFGPGCVYAATVNVPTQWQPIETAPKDRSSFLVYCPESGDVYHVYRYEGDDKFRIHASGGRVLYQRPTLWMPKPAPPKGD